MDYSKNNTIAFELGLDRKVLPSLVRLNREWENVFQSLSKDKEEMEQQLKTTLKTLQDLKAKDYIEENSRLINLLNDKENLINELEYTLDILREEVEALHNKQQVYQESGKKIFSAFKRN